MAAAATPIAVAVFGGAGEVTVVPLSATTPGADSVATDTGIEPPLAGLVTVVRVSVNLAPAPNVPPEMPLAKRFRTTDEAPVCSGCSPPVAPQTLAAGWGAPVQANVQRKANDVVSVPCG